MHQKNIRLSSIRLGQVDSTFPNDADIIQSSDNMIGKSRPDDFNTMVVMYSELNSSIKSIVSNIPPFVKINTISKMNLKTSDEAITDLKNNNTYLTLTLPTGVGIIDQNIDVS